jgi:hypothetical protein
MYELNGYSAVDFKEACRILKEKHPEMYEIFYAILRSQPMNISEEDMKKINSLHNKLSLDMLNTCDECGYYHPGGTCWDS